MLRVNRLCTNSDSLGTEQLATVATVVSPLGEREPDATRLTAVTHVILNPVVSHDPAGLVSD